MEKREQLMEEYEDALFALLMEEVAQVEGEKALALNEQLKADPAAAVPLHVQKRAQKTIRQAFAKKSAAAMKRGSIKLVRHISVAVFMLVLLFTVALAASPSFRACVLNVVVTAQEKFSELTVVPSSASRSEDSSVEVSGEGEPICNYNISLEWLPEGYELADGWSDESGALVKYSDNRGSCIIISIQPIESNITYRFDTEDAQQKAVTVQGLDAQLHEKIYGDNLQMFSVLWVDQINQVVIYLSSTGLSETELIQLAEGIQWAG